MRRVRSPVALGLAVAIAAVALATGVFAHELSSSVAGSGSFGWPALAAGRWWTLGTSLLLTRNLFMATTMPLAVGLALGAYERRAGSARAACVAAVGHVTASVVVALGVGALAATPSALLERAAQNLDYGASMVVAAALGALASRTGSRAFRITCFVGVVALVPIHHQMADWAHLVALPTGFLMDRARRPATRRVGLGLVAALTAWLVFAGAPLVSSATEAVRFATPPTIRRPGPSPTAAVQHVADFETERDEGHLVEVVYTAHLLGNRPAVARVYVPRRIPNPVAVALFFHGVPGAPADWVTGGRLTASLDRAIATHASPPMIAVLLDDPGFHDPHAGWRDVPGQATIASIAHDLLPALARRWPVDLGVRRVAAVAVGRGTSGALALARSDHRIGWLVALSPPTDVPTLSGVREIVTGPQARHATRRRVPHLNAIERWRRWAVELPGALAQLTNDGFGGSPS